VVLLRPTGARMRVSEEEGVERWRPGLGSKRVVVHSSGLLEEHSETNTPRSLYQIQRNKEAQNHLLLLILQPPTSLHIEASRILFTALYPFVLPPATSQILPNPSPSLSTTSSRSPSLRTVQRCYGSRRPLLKVYCTPPITPPPLSVFADRPLLLLSTSPLLPLVKKECQAAKS
jgi:hypothetical protein